MMMDTQTTEGVTASKKSPATRLSDVKSKQPEWLWKHRIPLGELTVMDGDPGNNKSSMLLDLAARVSTGRDMPDGTPGVRGGVLLMLGEDSLEKTILRRLQAADADLEQVSAIREHVLLPTDIKLVNRAITQSMARLVIVDPLMVFLAADANGDQKVRRALTPLKQIAERRDAAIVIVRHLTKRGGGNALYRGSGSIGIVGATRSALLVARDPQDSGMRVVCHTKSNLGPLSPSLLFEPVAADNGTVRIEWRGECDYSANELLSSRNSNENKLHEAETLLSDLLLREPVEVNLIRQRAIESGISWRTIERAKQSLGINAHHVGFGSGSKWLWVMPEVP